MEKLLPAAFLLYAKAVLVSLFMACTQVDAPSPVPSGQATELQVSKYGRAWVFYAQVNKAGNYFRRMYIDTLSARQLSHTGALPENTLIAMETWFGSAQSTVYIRQKGGQWLSGSFGPGSPTYQLALQASCNGCHSRAAATDFTFTKPLIQKALRQNKVQQITCSEPSFTPCDLAVYQGN